MHRTTMHRTTHALPALAATLSAALLLTACGSSDAADSQETATESATRTVESDFGEVTLPTDPQAALGMYTTDVDILITLGIPLAASQPIRGDSYTTFPEFFPQDALAGVTTFANFPEYNFEAILAAQPDLILNGLGYDDEVVEKLPTIAPTYSINSFDGSDWREKFEQVAIALDRTAEHDAWLSDYEAKVADVKERLDAADIHPVVAPVGYYDGTVGVSCYGVPCLVFADLGLEISPLATTEGTSLSLEQVEQLDGIDVAFRSTEPGESGVEQDEATLAELAQNPLWNELPFVANDQYFPYDMEMVYGSPSGQTAFLEVVEKALLG